MKKINIYKILTLFEIRNILKISPIKTGHINRTYLVEDRTGKYILQSLNRNVFKSPDAVMDNIKKIEQVFDNSRQEIIQIK